MPQAIYKWIDSTDRTRPRELRRPDDIVLRLVQLTDPHVPSDVELVGRLFDLISPHGKYKRLPHELSAISNELGHHFRASRRLYVNLIKKALAGLHKLAVDHLVITGDLAHCGLATEFLDMRGALEVTGWWGDEVLTVIPGNHDRFNLYENRPNEPMEAFFPVVTSRKPRFKILPGGIALLEIDSNRDPVDDRHHLERWLPNTVGRIYPEVLDWIERSHPEIRSMRLVTLLHHHISSDWYPRGPSTLGGLMDPIAEVDDLITAVELADPYSLILHGHKHDIMAVDYRYGQHFIGCPGGFATSFRLNLIDFNVHGEHLVTQIELRTPFHK